MGDPRWPWLHALGWTLLVSGATLYVLLEQIGAPPPRRSLMRWIFGVLTLIGAIFLVLYFWTNQSYLSVR